MYKKIGFLSTIRFICQYVDSRPPVCRMFSPPPRDGELSDDNETHEIRNTRADQNRTSEPFICSRSPLFHSLLLRNRAFEFAKNCR